MFTNTRGLVLREVKYRDTDKILTILTEDEGKLTVGVRGARGKGSKYAASTQLLCFSDLTLFKNRGRWSLNEASIIEPFLGVREDILHLALASYISELMEAVSDEDSPQVSILHLGLNALFALSNGLYQPMHIKSVFELRLMCLAGYTPSLDCCGICGSRNMENPMFNPLEGMVYCKSCNTEHYALMPLCLDSLLSMKHVISSQSKRVFSFSLTGKAQLRFYDICEKYVLSQMERSFRTLGYLKTLSENY